VLDAALTNPEYRVADRDHRGDLLGLLLVASTAILAACSPPSERPRDGAPENLVSRPAPTAYPTFSPSSAAEGTPPALTMLGQQPPDGSQSSPPSTSPSPPPAYVIGATDGAGANLRTGPSTSAPAITTLPEGTLVEVLEDPVSVEGRSWRHIRSGNREGWVVAVVVRPR
jgi:Bacterial SH3 domain